MTGEPLGGPGLAAKFRSLLGAGVKPFECVSEVTECRAAVLSAARREDQVALGIPMVGGLGFWFAEADLRCVLCLTGTKAKSPTS